MQIDPERIKAFQKLIDDSPIFVLEKQEPSEIILKYDLPDVVAAKFEELSPVSHHYNSVDGFSIYSDNKYQRVIDDKEIRLHIRKFLSKCKVEKRRKEGKEWVSYNEKLKKQSSGFVSDVLESLAAMKKVHILPSKKAPCSFNNALNPETIIALKNGLLDLSGPIPVMKPFTKNFYTFNYLPITYDPSKTAPIWSNKLLPYYFTEEDPNIPDKLAIKVLHSWILRFLRRITTPHKICVLVGLKRTGKSTIGRIICALLGHINTSSITIASLAGPHGTYGLMNKQLGIMWDAKVMGNSGDIAKAVEVMKNISGQDNIAVNPKGRDIIELEALKLNILMIANVMADLRDNTGALASRFTFLKTTQTFLGSEDPSFEKNVIKNELSGILNLVLSAPTTILEHPQSSIMAQEFLEMSSPYTAFSNNCCVVGDSDSFIPIDVLWAYYCDWCSKFNHRPPSAQKFKIEFMSAIGTVKRYRPGLSLDQRECLEKEHGLGHRPGHKLHISARPHCYKGIDVLEEIKGQWYCPSKSKYSPDDVQDSDLF